MSEVKRKESKDATKAPKGKKTVHKPDEERWNKSLGGTWVDISKVEFISKSK